jgi:exopolysaccharide biosynthesis protein
MQAVVRRAFASCLLVLLTLAPARAQRLALGEARNVAAGILLYHLEDRSLLTPEAPVSIWLLRLEPARVDLRAELANDEIMDTETVADIAERHKAIAAVNAGFFLPNGDPAGVLTIDRRLVSDTRKPRGAVGIVRTPNGPRLIFARLKVTASLVIQPGRKDSVRVPLDGVDTTRLRGQIMLFTPAYHADTDTATGGLEWVIDGEPGKVVSGPHRTGKTRIPRRGFVISFGGTETPAALARLTRGTRVALDVSYDPVDGETGIWSSAHYVIGGAGLLVRNGRDIDDWSMEAFNQGFAENRHPRTMVGTSTDGAIWLVTVDGRQPQLSAGMTLVELRDLAHRLELANALNLDGGGSTTMWIKGQIVNSPSDATGPRKVSDAILVYPGSADRGARMP